MNKRRLRTIFNYREEGGKGGRIFSSVTKVSHLRKPFKLHTHMCILVSTKDPKMRIIVTKKQAKEAMSKDCTWRIHENG